MNTSPQTMVRTAEAALATNKLIRNTFTLLAMTLLFSAATAGVSMATGLRFHWLVSLGGMLGFLFLTYKFKNSGLGLLFVFAFTGFMGLTLGPLLNFHLSLPNGSETVMGAMGLTGAIFLGLSGYALTSRKDFSFMGGFLFAGLIVGLIGGLSLIFFPIPAMSLAISALMVLVASGYILFDVSRMVHGGEDNYILITVSLFMDIYLLFVHLLNLLGVMGGDD